MDTPCENGNGSSMYARWCELAIWASVLGAFATMNRLPDLPLCPVHYLTGMECPTCGVTRSVWYLLHGNCAGGLQSNPLGLIVVAVLLRRLVSLLFLKSLVVHWANAEFVNLSLLIAFVGIGTYRCLMGLL